MKLNKKLLSLAVTTAAATVTGAAFAAVTVTDPDGDATRANAPRIGPGGTQTADSIQIVFGAATDTQGTASAPATFYVDAPSGTSFSKAPTAAVTGSVFLSDGTGGISQKIMGTLNGTNTRATWSIAQGTTGTVDISGPSLTLAAETVFTPLGPFSKGSENDLTYTVSTLPTGAGATPSITSTNVAAVKVGSTATEQLIENSGVSFTKINVPANISTNTSPDLKKFSLLLTVPGTTGGDIVITAPTTINFTAGGSITAPATTTLNGSAAITGGDGTIKISGSPGNIITIPTITNTFGPGPSPFPSQVKLDIGGFLTSNGVTNSSTGVLPLVISGTAGVSNAGLAVAEIVNATTSYTAGVAGKVATLTKGAQNPQAFSAASITESFTNVISGLNGGNATFEITTPSGVTFGAAAVAEGKTSTETLVGPGVLNATNTKLTVTTSSAADTGKAAGSISLTGSVVVGDTYAGSTVPLTITNVSSGVTNGTVVVANVVAPSVDVKSGVVAPATTRVVGIGSKSALDTLVITEVTSGSIQVPGVLNGGGLGSINITAPEGVTINSATATPTALTLSSPTGFVADGGSTVSFQVSKEAVPPAKASLGVAITATVGSTVAPGTDLSFTVGGTSGASGSAVLATANVATKASAADLKDIASSPTAQAVGKITVTENFPTALTAGTFRLIAPAGVSFASSGHVLTGPVNAAPTVQTAQNPNDTLEIAVVGPTANTDAITIVPNMFVTTSFPDDTIISVDILDGDAAGTKGAGAGVTTDAVDIAFNGTSVALSVGGNVDVNQGFTKATTVEGQGTITATSSDEAIATVVVADGMIWVTGVGAGTATITVMDSRTSTTFEAIVGELAAPPSIPGQAIGGDGTETFSGGVTAGGDPFASTFTAGSDIRFVGVVGPQVGDVGSGGELFAAVKFEPAGGGAPSFQYVNTEGALEDWDLSNPANAADTLGAAVVLDALAATNNVSIDIPDAPAGLYKFYMAYAVEGGTLIYTGKALKVTVE